MHLEPTALWSSDTVELFLLREEHVGPRYVGWLGDPSVNRFLECRFETHDAASTVGFVRACVESTDTLLLGIRAVALDRRHIGNIKLGPVHRPHGLADIGILIGETTAWGQGLATQAITMVCRIARETLALRKVCAGCYADNVGSRMAFEHAGFEVDAVRRAHFLLDGRPHDLVQLARWLH